MMTSFMIFFAGTVICLLLVFAFGRTIIFPLLGTAAESTPQSIAEQLRTYITEAQLVGINGSYEAKLIIPSGYDIAVTRSTNGFLVDVRATKLLIGEATYTGPIINDFMVKPFGVHTLRATPLYISKAAGSDTVEMRYGKELGLVAYWKMDEDGEATVIEDSSGGGHSGELYGHVKWSNEKGIVALQFPGESSIKTGIKTYVKVKDDYELDNDFAFTLEAFVKPSGCSDSNGNTPAIIGKWRTSGEKGDGDYILWIPGCSLQLTVGWYNISNQFNWSSISGGNVKPGSWYHVVATFDNGNATLYINGAKVVNQQLPVNYTELAEYENDDIFIGALWSGAYAFNGLIDEVKIYGYSVGEETVKNHCRQYSTKYGITCAT